MQTVYFDGKNRKWEEVRKDDCEQEERVKFTVIRIMYRRVGHQPKNYDLEPSTVRGIKNRGIEENL